MAIYHVRYHVRYDGGSWEEFDEALSQEKYSWYCDGGSGGARLREMAARRDYKGKKVIGVEMRTQRIEY